MSYPPRPTYQKVYEALADLHKTLMKIPGRDVLSLSNGPFSRVNEVLGLVSQLEADLYRTKRSLDQKIKQEKHRQRIEDLSCD